MLYVIDFPVDLAAPSERLAKWRALPHEWQVCLLHESAPDPIELEPTDLVFAHSKHFRSDLTDAAYERDPEVRETLFTLFKGDNDKVKKGITNVLALRTALRNAGHAKAPRLVIFSGAANLAPKANWMREDVCRVSLPGFPKEKVSIGDITVPRNISSQQLERLVSSIMSLPRSTASPSAAAAAAERLWTIYLLCDAYRLNEGSAEKPHGGTRLRAPTRPLQWFSPLGKSPCEKAAKEIAAEVPNPEAAAAVEAFLKKVAKSRPTANEVETTMANLSAALRPPPAR